MSLLELGDVKPHLKIDQNTDDTVRQGKLDAAEAYVSRQTGGSGGLAVTAVTERIPGLRASLPLSFAPVVSVTSVTGAGSNPLVVADLDVDTEQALVGYSPLGNVVFPLPWYSVVYSSGYASAADLPDELVEAVRLMTQHFYATQRGSNRRATGGAPGTEPDAFARARQIIDDFNSYPGFA